MTDTSSPGSTHSYDRVLFWGCFVALVATAFAFIVRAMLLDTWGIEFNLTQTQKGEIQGVGLWPFAISIVLFSLVIDRVGYRTAMFFAFACHVTSAVLTIFAWDYWSLWIATFIVALGNGTVEAFINPVVATLFRHAKTKWLNILHAGWPGGLVLGGLLAMLLVDMDWRVRVGLLLIPTLLYGAMLARRPFPVHERVEAGVSQREMMKEAGGLGMFLVLFLILAEIGRLAGWGTLPAAVAAAVLATIYGIAVGSVGRLMFVLLLVIMIPLATTELGTDSWITAIMTGEMHALGLDPGWVLVYTAAIMMVLRFFAGPIVHRLSPLGLLATSSLIAAVGLFFLSKSTGMTIFLAATLYGLGKTFFWPTMLGVVAERFPKGGALTLNATGGVGMLSVGVVGTVFLGFWQDTGTVERLQARLPEVAARVVVEKNSVLGTYRAIDHEKLRAATPRVEDEARRRREIQQALVAKLGRVPRGAELERALGSDPAYQALLRDPLYAEQKRWRDEIERMVGASQKDALTQVAMFPILMLVCYLGLILYFRARGGYTAEVLTGHAARDERFTGGVEGPADG